MSRWTNADIAARGARVVGVVETLEAKCNRGSKYGNESTRGFDSKHEAKCARELELRVLAGEINHLRYQVPFELIPVQRDEAGKLLERSCVYVADFVFEESEKEVVADAKGHCNRVWIVKRKLMLFLKGIRIREM